MSTKYEIHTDIVVDHYKNHIHHKKKYKHVLNHLLIYNIAYYYHDLGDMSHLSMTSNSVEDIICTLNKCKCCKRHQIDRPDCLYADKRTYLCMYSLDEAYNRNVLNNTTDKTKTSTPHIIPDKYVHCNCICRNTSRALLRHFNPDSYYEQERLWIIDTLYSQIKYIQLNLKLYYQETLQYTNRLSEFISNIQYMLDNIVSDITTNHIINITYEFLEQRVDIDMMQGFQQSIMKLLNSIYETIENIHLQWSDVLDIHASYIEHLYDHSNIEFPQDDEIQVLYINIEELLIKTMKKTEPYFEETYSASIKTFFTTLDSICKKKYYFYRSLYMQLFEDCATNINNIKNEIIQIKDLQLNTNINIDESYTDDSGETL